jgi:hypothetical protein
VLLGAVEGGVPFHRPARLTFNDQSACYAGGDLRRVNSADGKWEVEDVGVAPDVEVEQDPALVRVGQNPQVEKAINVVLAPPGEQRIAEAGQADASGLHLGRRG